MKTLIRFAVVLAALFFAAGRPSGQQPQQEQDRFRFRTGVELINVTATVTDSSGRFVPGLRKEDFVIYEDDRPQTVTHFNNERVPVSLGIALDTSGSMDGEKIESAQRALDRFLFELLDPNDEIFLYRFDSDPELLEGWTTDRRRITRALGRIDPRGGTALYDTVAEAVPMAQTGSRRKKAVVVISDGNDTSSRTDLRSVRQLIRETEVLVYAIGIDGRGGSGGNYRRPLPQPRFPIPIPFPFPGRRTPPQIPPSRPYPGSRTSSSADDSVNEGVLREITEDSGGRTEIISSARDLDPATAGIADELSRQYFLAYVSPGHKDGRWHSIRVEVKRGSGYTVRARRGYVAS
jgi:Ca-activated chloride channel family protein